ncbi:LPXTG cell wall anchor domain-containing protein [Eremococcus coleocola]|uniref:LPXTG cell wall anchor domain-containing protein n=1 Tax=Eremococcus coleocola TaxID=88132 RepID=UPI00040C356E|nr:LPXTG cell wall anchor domain-containing protein [Eremococcus coleocola]
MTEEDKLEEDTPKKNDQIILDENVQAQPASVATLPNTGENYSWTMLLALCLLSLAGILIPNCKHN